MKTMEIIHVRLAGNGPDDLLDIICSSVGNASEIKEVKIYRHLKLENDVAIHLHRKPGGSENNLSNIGLRLASLLKDLGMVSHSIWSECCCVEDGFETEKTGWEVKEK